MHDYHENNDLYESVEKEMCVCCFFFASIRLEESTYFVYCTMSCVHVSNELNTETILYTLGKMELETTIEDEIKIRELFE